MPWPDGNLEMIREEFVSLAVQPGACIYRLCQQFNISRKTGYKWLKRIRESSSSCFADQSRKPHHIKYRISKEVEEQIITTRCLYPHWGAAKIKAYLLNRHVASCLPAIRTINKILAREELTRIHQGERHTAYKRFEHTRPNSLWQMDFKGYFSLTDGTNCHPLTIIDDHSRYLICLAACHNQNFKTVKPILIAIFSRYGLPDAIALDHGACWKPKSRQQWSELTVWLIRLGVRIIHGQPYHPQSRGKDERLHRTLKLELINHVSMENLLDCQRSFDLWRHTYNQIRPHEALGLQPPVTRYQISQRHFLKESNPIQYWEDDIIRHIDMNGMMHIAGRSILLSKALRNQPVALRPSQDGKKLHIFFCQQLIKSINHPDAPIKRGRRSVTHVKA